MLAYLWVQRYKGTEILKQNHFGIKTYKKQKTETTAWISWAEVSVCVYPAALPLCTAGWV